MNLHHKLGLVVLVLGLQACASQGERAAHAEHGGSPAKFDAAQHDEDMARHGKDMAKHSEDMAKHKEAMAKHKEGMGQKMHGMAGMAMASLSPAASGGATGLVVFHAKGEDLMVHVKASGFVPGTAHGFHVHANGSCASPDFSSAGGHFNPGGQPHGPQDGARHAGDMPNLQADAQGKVDQKFVLKGAKLQGDAGLLGRAVIVHADPDDFKTQPTGNSGARIACGVIAAH